MPPDIHPRSIPDVVLIMGTDAAGKDHVANIVAKMITEAGGAVEKRKRFLTGKVTRKASSTDKHPFELYLERVFLLLHPSLGFLLPTALNLLLKYDLNSFSRPDKKLIIVGHNCLRGLAFHWGHACAGTDQIRVPPGLQATLARMRSLAGLHPLVLDVDDRIRKARIRTRLALGEADYFDRYMAENSARAERIEAVLVWLTLEYLNGQLIENNDLSEVELRKHIAAGFVGVKEGTVP